MNGFVFQIGVGIAGVFIGIGIFRGLGLRPMPNSGWVSDPNYPACVAGSVRTLPDGTTFCHRYRP